MKRFLGIVIIGVFVNFNLIAQGGKVTINGKITNPKEESTFINKTGFFSSESVCKLEVDKQGTFSAEFEIEKESYFSFNHNKELTVIYLMPGDNIEISLNTDEFDETVAYKGKGAGINNYLAKKYLLNEQLSPGFKKLYSMSPDSFFQKTMQIKRDLEEQLEKFISSGENLSKEFQKMAIADIHYSWANQLNAYPRAHKNYTKKDFDDADGKFDQYFSEGLVYNSELMEVVSYRSYLGNHVNREVTERIKNDSTLKNFTAYNTRVSFSVINDMIKEQKIKNFLMTSILNSKIRYSGIYGLEEIFAEYKQKCSNEDFLRMLNEEYEKWSHLASGKPAPDFTYADINGKEFSLSDFKGKYVYIDVWATWCSPCKKEIPHLEELEEAMNQYNLEFISVSVDTDKKKWEKMVKEKEMKGVQLYAKGWETSITKDYYIKGIPRFILIDRDGNIINANAPRPSGEIKDILDKLEGIQG